MGDPRFQAQQIAPHQNRMLEPNRDYNRFAYEHWLWCFYQQLTRCIQNCIVHLHRCYAWTGGTAQVLNDTVHWTGPLGADDRVTMTYQLALPRYLMQPAVYSVAFLEDSIEGAWERPMWVVLNPWRAYLPVVYRRFAGARRVFLPVVSRDG